MRDSASQVAIGRCVRQLVLSYRIVCSRPCCSVARQQNETDQTCGHELKDGGAGKWEERPRHARCTVFAALRPLVSAADAQLSSLPTAFSWQAHALSNATDVGDAAPAAHVALAARLTGRSSKIAVAVAPSAVGDPRSASSAPPTGCRRRNPPHALRRRHGQAVGGGVPADAGSCSTDALRRASSVQNVAGQ